MKLRHLVVWFGIAIAAGCGSKTPTGPSDPGPVVTNTPPVIGKFTIAGSRANILSNFAETQEDVPISVEVTDAESSISSLKFNWSSAVGTFSGTGPSVTWKAPADAATPADVTINLEVVETYTSQGKSVENKPTASTTVRLHNSAKEVGDMSRQFLLDFSDSSMTDVSVVLRNFQRGEPGSESEAEDVARNRRDFKIIDWRVDNATTTINFGGSCPMFDGRPPVRGDACSKVRTHWESRALRTFDDIVKDRVYTTNGVDFLTARYYPEQKRWRLIDSQFDGDESNSLKQFQLRSLVP